MKGLQFFKTIQLKLIVIYVLMILFAMQLIGIYFVNALESSFTKNFSDSMDNDARLLVQYISEKNLSPDPEARPEDIQKSREDLDRLVEEWYKVNNSEMQILNANGEVISMSNPNPAIIGQKNTQQVVSRALQSIKDKETERDITDIDGLRKKMMARPVTKDGKVIGAVYIVKSMEDLYANISRINQIFLTGTIIALALTAVLGVILSSTITNPIKEITRQATSVAEGNFDRRLRVYGQDEIGQLSNAFNNMTARLKEALAINEEENEKLTSILTNMNDGVLATDEWGRVIVMNRRAKQMLGVEERVAIGMDLFALLGIPREPELLAARDEAQWKVISLPDRGEDEELQVRLSVTSIHRREKGISGNIVVLQDVTEQEKLEWARREFVANVSHELRTPLTTIKSYLEALEDGALEEPELAKRFIGVTRNESERMIRLVTDLLHLSRLDSKQAELKKQPTDVGEMLEEVADRFSFQLRQRNLAIAIRVSPAVGKVRLDRDQIDQVLDNLVSNAIKYAGDGGHLVITAQFTTADRKYLEISVEDDGIGIPKKDISRIFERFYRVDKARSRNMGGTGLGLSIAREIVKAHGGTITLESELNQGTKVAFTLPILADESGVAD